jgi:hypothetical protein
VVGVSAVLKEYNTALIGDMGHELDFNHVPVFGIYVQAKIVLTDEAVLKGNPLAARTPFVDLDLYEKKPSRRANAKVIHSPSPATGYFIR